MTLRIALLSAAALALPAVAGAQVTPPATNPPAAGTQTTPPVANPAPAVTEDEATRTAQERTQRAEQAADEVEADAATQAQMQAQTQAPPPPAEAPATAQTGTQVQTGTQAQIQATAPSPTQPAAQAQTPAPAGPTVVATQADLTTGAQVRDQTGGLVGTIESVDAAGAVIATGTVRARLPLASFARNNQGLVIAMTRTQLEAAVAAQSQSAPTPGG